MQEFTTFRSDIETKNNLIAQLKETIVEVTEAKKKQDAKDKHNSEIEQLKQMIAQMTSHIA